MGGFTKNSKKSASGRIRTQGVKIHLTMPIHWDTGMSMENGYGIYWNTTLTCRLWTRRWMPQNAAGSRRRCRCWLSLLFRLYCGQAPSSFASRLCLINSLFRICLRAFVFSNLRGCSELLGHQQIGDHDITNVE